MARADRKASRDSTDWDALWPVSLDKPLSGSGGAGHGGESYTVASAHERIPGAPDPFEYIAEAESLAEIRRVIGTDAIEVIERMDERTLAHLREKLIEAGITPRGAEHPRVKQWQDRATVKEYERRPIRAYQHGSLFDRTKGGFALVGKSRANSAVAFKVARARGGVTEAPMNEPDLRGVIRWDDPRWRKRA